MALARTFEPSVAAPKIPREIDRDLEDALVKALSHRERLKVDVENQIEDRTARVNQSRGQAMLRFSQNVDRKGKRRTPPAPRKLARMVRFRSR